jgi:hypothetical protein
MQTLQNTISNTICVKLKTPSLTTPPTSELREVTPKMYAIEIMCSDYLSSKQNCPTGKIFETKQRP